MRLKRILSPNNPTLKAAEDAIRDRSYSIRASLATLKRQYGIKLKDLQKQAGVYDEDLTSSPSKERTLNQIKRQQEVKSGLFVMLLQKREENLIQLASTIYKAKEIERPACKGYISPRSDLVYFFALLLALISPYLLFFCQRYFKVRITTREEIQEITKIPILGIVPFVKALVKGKRTIVIEENRNSVMMEAYRQLRAALPFVMKPDDKVMLFTSCVSGEGKTSIACNLGTSIAITGKRVLIMGLDIRKPRLAGLFGHEDYEKGISDYLAKNKDDFDLLDSIIIPTNINKNIDLIVAGTIPPNPSELLSRPFLGNALEHLKEKYDYIIMDTAPLGLVSDTLSLTRLADITFYIVRYNYTLKADMGIINEYYSQGMMPNVNIIFNAVSFDSCRLKMLLLGWFRY